MSGKYQPLYTPLAGDCGPITTPNMVEFMGDTSGMHTITEMRLNEDVTTVVVLKGCTVRVEQTVSAKSGQVQSQLDGDGIRVHSANKLRGQMTYVKFNAMNQVMCQGTYDATFEKNLVPMGALY